MKLVYFEYCKDPNDISSAIKRHRENDFNRIPNEDGDWEGLNDAEDIISIVYRPDLGCYVVFWKAFV